MKIEGYFRSGYDVNLPVLIIAEIGVNHNGRMELARNLIERAVECGADAVKFQAFISERMIVSGTPKVFYQTRATSANEDQDTMLKRFQFSAVQLKELKQYAEMKGVLFLCSVFDQESAFQLNELGIGVFKIPSGELTNLPLIKQVASYGKPMFISTGMADLGEVDAAVQAAQKEGNRQLMLMHCVSQYPAPFDSLNLKVIQTLSQAFHVPVGFSDHSQGVTAAMLSIACGARAVEKHFTLNRCLEGPDHQASLEPEEFKRLAQVIRDAEKALGDGCKIISSGEMAIRSLTRKSIVTAADILQGTVLTSNHIDFKRPGNGISPALIDDVLGRRTVRVLPKDTILQWTDLEAPDLRDGGIE